MLKYFHMINENKKTIFEKIVDREIPAHIVNETENTLAFLDVSPNHKGHTLVITKKPFENIYEVPDELLGELFQVVKNISIAVKNAVEADGINILQNNEPAAGQVVFHSHVHIIPRFQDDGGYHGKHQKYNDGEAEEIRDRIISELKK